MMPLAPRDRLSGVKGGGEGAGHGIRTAIDGEGEGCIVMRCVEEIGDIGDGFGGLDGEIEPLARFVPPDVEQAEGRDHFVAGRIEIVELFGEGDIDAFVPTEFVEVGAVGGI